MDENILNMILGFLCLLYLYSIYDTCIVHPAKVEKDPSLQYELINWYCIIITIIILIIGGTPFIFV